MILCKQVLMKSILQMRRFLFILVLSIMINVGFPGYALVSETQKISSIQVDSEPAPSITTVSMHKISGYILPDFTFSQDVEKEIKKGFTVEITNTSMTTSTDDNGFFEINAPDSSTGYLIRIKKNGFLCREIQNITLNSDIQLGSQTSKIPIWPGDMPENGVQDGAVNMADIMVIAQSFNTVMGNVRYARTSDFNLDNAVNMEDIMIAARSFGKTTASYEPVPILGDPTDILPPDRRMKWEPGIPGGIPQNTTVFTTINASIYGNGKTDASAAINHAIEAAGAVASEEKRQVVYLPEGTYLVKEPVMLNKNNVILRGAGPRQTRIVGAIPGVFTLAVGYKFDYEPAIDVISDALKGTTSITLKDASSIQIGDILQIDQQDGPAVPTGEGHFLNGMVWLADAQYFKRQPEVDIQGPGTGGIPWRNMGDWLQTVNWNAQNSGPWRSITQQIEVAGKQGNTLMLRDPLYLDFTISHKPQVFKTIPVSQDLNLGTRWAGLEDLAVTGGNNDNIRMVNVAYCWLKNIESDGESVAGRIEKPGMDGQSVVLTHAYRCIIRDSYFHHARTIVNGGCAYGIVVGSGSSANLIENNIAVWLNKPIVMNVSGGGNVVAYNYVDNAMIMGHPWQENGIDGCHDTFSHSDLFEGNYTPNIGSDSTHGNSGFHVFFRNFATSRNSMPYDIGEGVGLPWQNVRAVGVDALSREHTFIGNVLNVADIGDGTYYEANPASHPEGSSVYHLGDNGNGGTGGIWDNGMAASFVYRHGNWDNVSGKVIWDSSNSIHTLPSSLYLTSKPDFFGENPWPWVEPTANTCIYTLPAQKRYDAMK